MEILGFGSPTIFFNISSFSSKSNKRIINKSNKHRSNIPISKFSYHRASNLRISAQFGEPTRRRNSLRKKIIGDENFRTNHTSSSDSGTKPIDHSDDLVSLSINEGLKEDILSVDSNLLNELEDWVARYKKESDYWGIGSKPIFTVYKDLVGKVEKVDVDEEEIFSRIRTMGLEDLKSVSSKVVYAKKLAREMENGEDVLHKDSTLVKFVVASSSKEEFGFVSSIRNAVIRLDLVPKLPAIGRAVLCGYLGLWLLKTVLVYKKSDDEVECTELEKEMMRRKMKAWKEKETMEKGSVEVLQEEEEEPLVSFEKPKFDRKELMSNIYKVKGSDDKVELLNSSMDFGHKIEEIKVMARRAREIEAAIELNEKDKRDVNKETSEDGVDISIQSQNNPLDEALIDNEDESLVILSENDQENTEVSGLSAPIVNGATIDSSFSNHHTEKESNVVPLVPSDRINESSDAKSSMTKNSTGRKSRVIRSVKEAKEFLSRQSGGRELTQEPSHTTAKDSDEISLKHKDEESAVAKNNKLVRKNKITSINGTMKKSTLESTFSESLRKEQDRTSLYESGESTSGVTEQKKKENWMEKNYHEIQPFSEKMRAGFKDNYMAAREKETKEPSTIAEITELYRNEDKDELEWMKDESLRDVVFRVRDNELAGRDPFHLVDVEDKAVFMQGLEKKIEKENEKMSHLHQWIHSNIENIDYGVDGISVHDPPEKVIPRWKGPSSLDKSPEFLDNYHEQREALFSRKSSSLSPMKKEEQSSLNEDLSQAVSSENTSTSSLSETTTSKPKIVVEGSDGSVRPGKKSGKEYWQHTKKWSSGFLELYNAETDPETKAVMRDMGKDLDRWITEDEIKDAADIMEKLPEKNKKFMEKKLEKLKREMELFGPQAVMGKYREYGEDNQEDYLWWLDLPHVLCLELYTEDSKGEQQVGFYTLEMATDLEIEPKPHHVIAFENATDCKSLCYIIQAHLDMLKTGNAFIVPRPPKDAYREAKANGFGVTVIKKGELKLNIDEALEEVEERICEIGSKMYHDKIMGERSVDISSLMKGVFNLKTKPNTRSRRRKTRPKFGLNNPKNNNK
ncbi:unnamed protein product [Cochlearia groenlandica]